MNNIEINTFKPDYAIHPGEILEETLEARGIKKTALAERCGIALKTVSQIINGKTLISPAIAIKLERALGVSASLWSNLTTDYELFVAREADYIRLERQKQWVKKFPLQQLADLNLVPRTRDRTEDLSNLLSFFGVSSITAWNECYLTPKVAYRRSAAYKSHPESMATWLRIGELMSESVECASFDKKKFKAALAEIKNVTNEPVEIFQKIMVDSCCDAGVALVFVPELPKTHVSGATKWLTSNKAMIILSLRHKMDDHFWFSFFHEAAHILLHGKTEIFIENFETKRSEKEIEADIFASNFLIQKSKYKKFTSLKKISSQSVLAFAEKLNLAPGIVVGRLQHDGVIPYSWFNKLKRKFDVSPQESK
jgi:addiction module HigA family antidote